MLFTVSLLSKLLKRLYKKKSHTLEEYILPIIFFICGIGHKDLKEFPNKSIKLIKSL